MPATTENAFPSTSNAVDVGRYCHDLAKKLFPICRSLSGPGVRETLQHLAKELAALTVHTVPTGSKAFDWDVPDEWTIRDAYVENEHGERIIDFRQHNLHVLGYSEPVDRWMDLEELEEHLHSLPEQPELIPYITSYYKRRWGFCLSHAQRQGLKPGRYRAVVDADLKPGVLNYGEVILPGRTDREIFISTYICHPSMANNELSGPVVTTAIVRWLSSIDRNYTYRIVFIPETIGSLIYLQEHVDHLKEKVDAGFVVTCIGDERCYSYLPSRSGGTLADRASLHALKHIDPGFIRYTWWDRGSDERQYCSPGVDLPMATIMRSKYGEYPEYHTSADDLTLVTPEGLGGGFLALQTAISIIEADDTYRVTTLGEPQLGKRGLYPTLSTKATSAQVRSMMNIISACDGSKSVLDIAELIGEPALRVAEIIKPLIASGLLEKA